MPRLKLAVVTQFPADAGIPRGGVEAVSVNLVRALAATGELEVHVVTLDPQVAAPRADAWSGARIHRLPRGSGGELANALGAGRRAIQDCLRALTPDLVHAHDTYGLMVQGLMRPRVFTIHGFIYGDTLVSGRKLPWLRSRIWEYFEKRGWADQPHIISISPYVRERLAGVSTAVIHDIDNPIAPDFFDIARAERAGTVFCAAAICPRKNTLALIEAAARLRARGIAVELRLAGAITDPGYGARVERTIATHALGEQVRMLGLIGTGQVRAELAQAAVFALVSLEENSPMGIEEAMAARVPVLTANRCGMPYMVRHGETGFLVDPLDVADVARRLETLLGDAPRRAAMGEAGRQVALARFHPDAVARRTLEVYREIVAAARA
ncbi:MAG: glycosyltransferase family 4 protein [Gammaproteobacteria bacterium]|nr:glycosyltransferase family 4 protein [Gammaproteobacteria bacterium]